MSHIKLRHAGIHQALEFPRYQHRIVLEGWTFGSTFQCNAAQKNSGRKEVSDQCLLI